MPEEPDERPAQRPSRSRRRGRPVTFRYPPESGPCADEAALELLSEGSLKIEGRLVAASNATMYCTVRRRGQTAACVYKPVAGERPLWDFPLGTLAGREVAAYAVSQAAGWHLVPPTVMRDGPFGPGMCQLWIDADASTDLVALARSRDQPKLRDMAVFDAVVNNADRKIGHLLPVADGAAVRLRPRGLLRRGVQAAHRAVAVARAEAARPGADRARQAQGGTGRRGAGHHAGGAAVT